MSSSIEIRGLKELFARFKGYPKKFAKVVKKTTFAALLVLWENVFPYPPPPSLGGYVRTGNLGKSLGTGMSGGKMGQPDILKVTKLGNAGFVGKFGSRLGYAPKVIGDIGQQDSFFAQYWWRLEQVIAPSMEKIMKLYDIAAQELAKFLDGKGL